MKHVKIDPGDYPAIRHIQLGDSIKTAHIGCSNSAAMKITCVAEGIHMYCFKCHSYLFLSAENSPRELLKKQKLIARATAKAQAEKSYTLPFDARDTEKISMPVSALAWLGKGGWTLKMQREYCVTWSSSLNRVLIPVFPVGYIARAVENWQEPKYLEKAPENAFWMSSSAKQKRPGKGLTSCVICEDVLSAGRVGKYFPAFSMLGTTLNSALLATLLPYDNIYLWLDNDRGGRTGVQKAINRLRLISDVKIITSKNDPKYLTDTEIITEITKELLQ